MTMGIATLRRDPRWSVKRWMCTHCRSAGATPLPWGLDRACVVGQSLQTHEAVRREGRALGLRCPPPQAVDCGCRCRESDHEQRGEHGRDPQRDPAGEAEGVPAGTAVLWPVSPLGLGVERRPRVGHGGVGAGGPEAGESFGSDLTAASGQPSGPARSRQPLAVDHQPPAVNGQSFVHTVRMSSLCQ